MRSGRGQVGVEDVTAVVSDASALALDDIVDAAFAGRPAELEAQLAKARTAGTAAGSILFNAQRQVAQLHKWRTAIEDGAAFSLDAVQPPLHFRRKALVEAALKAWNAARLTTAMAELADAVLESRRNADARRHHRRARVVGDRDARPRAARHKRSCRRLLLRTRRTLSRSAGQSASLLRPTSDILAAAEAIMSWRT